MKVTVILNVVGKSGKKTGVIGDQWKSRDHVEYKAIEIS